MAYNSKYTGAQVEALLDKADGMEPYDCTAFFECHEGEDCSQDFVQLETKALSKKRPLFTRYTDHDDYMEYSEVFAKVYNSNIDDNDSPLILLYNFSEDLVLSYVLIGPYSGDDQGYASIKELRTVEIQKLLVSGTDIKTINGQSLLGAGDIAISWMGTTVVKRCESTIGYGTGYDPSSPYIELATDKLYIVGRCTDLTLTLPDGADSDGQEYRCQFYVGDENFALTIPSGVHWQDGEAPAFEANTCCQLVIVNNCATIGVFKA